MRGFRDSLVLTESEFNFGIYQSLLDLAEAYNLDAKTLIYFFYKGISLSEYNCLIVVYQSYPSMSHSSLFWTTCTQFMFDLGMKPHAGKGLM